MVVREQGGEEAAWWGVGGFYVFVDLNPTQTDCGSHSSAAFRRIFPFYPRTGHMVGCDPGELGDDSQSSSKLCGVRESIVEKARAWMVGLVGVGSEDVKGFWGLVSR